MRASRFFRLIFRILLYVCTISLTIVTLLGGLSAITIVSNPDNVGIPDGDIELYIDPITPANNNITVPFNFTNDGYFTLNNLYIHVRLNMTYDHVNLTTPGVNETTTRTIFDGEQTFDSVSPNAILDDVQLVGVAADFSLPSISDIDFSVLPTFTIDIILSASYSLDLISFRVELLGISISSLS